MLLFDNIAGTVGVMSLQIYKHIYVTDDKFSVLKNWPCHEDLFKQTMESSRNNETFCVL